VKKWENSCMTGRKDGKNRVEKVPPAPRKRK